MCHLCGCDGEEMRENEGVDESEGGEKERTNEKKERRRGK